MSLAVSPYQIGKLQQNCNTSCTEQLYKAQQAAFYQMLAAYIQLESRLVLASNESDSSFAIIKEEFSNILHAYRSFEMTVRAASVNSSVIEDSSTSIENLEAKITEVVLSILAADHALKDKQTFSQGFINFTRNYVQQFVPELSQINDQEFYNFYKNEGNLSQIGSLYNVLSHVSNV